MKMYSVRHTYRYEEFTTIEAESEAEALQEAENVDWSYGEIINPTNEIVEEIE